MKTNYIRTISIALLGLSLGLWASVIIPSMLAKKPETIPQNKPSFQEQDLTLTDSEKATMAASFVADFEKNLETMQTSPTPTPIFHMDTPASMAGDLNPPVVTIQGGPQEGAVLTTTGVCFPLWLSDNMTPWQQLQTRGKLDMGQWSPWLPQTSYCYSNLGSGAHTFSVQIQDLAGNISSETKRTFIVKQ